ncbi:MAG: polysaccharide deacetylase family protein [Methylomarinum sp.]|nr:polysaccharide deacetylase family protein [Methylomarinum sp.]
MLTIDVESLSTGNPKSSIFGRLDGYSGDNGVPLILDILDRNQSKATFYLNVYEIAKYGEHDIKKIAETIVAKEQDIQLHTHPEHMYGKHGMTLFKPDKQEQIIRKGKELLEQWTKKTIIAHRAGAFLANSDTLSALIKTGISVDASLNPAFNSPLYQEGYQYNDIVMINDTFEIPVTYYTQLKFMDWESKRHLDIESSSLSELKSVLDQMAEQDSCAANIMMHSFSITRFGYPDQRIVSKLDALLQYIKSHPKLTTSNTEDFFEAYKNNSLSCSATPDFVAHTGVIYTYLRSWERFGDGWKNIVFALSVPAFILLIVIITLLSMRLKKI